MITQIVENEMENIRIKTGNNGKKIVYIIWFLLVSAYLIYFLVSNKDVIAPAMIILIFTLFPIVLFFDEHFKKIALSFHDGYIFIEENTIFKKNIKVKIADIVKIGKQRLASIGIRGPSGPITYQSPTESASTTGNVYAIILVLVNKQKIVFGEGMKEEHANQIKLKKF